MITAHSKQKVIKCSFIHMEIQNHFPIYNIYSNTLVHSSPHLPVYCMGRWVRLHCFFQMGILNMIQHFMHKYYQAVNIISHLTALRVGVFRDLEGRGLIWAVEGKNKCQRKDKIPFCRDMSCLFGKSVLRGRKVLNHFASTLFFSVLYQYEYMSWHVLLACTVGMCCTDYIVPFLHYRRGNLYVMGTVGNGGRERGGGGGQSGCSTPSAPVALVIPGPGGGGEGGCLPGCMQTPAYTVISLDVQAFVSFDHVLKGSCHDSHHVHHV